MDIDVDMGMLTFASGSFDKGSIFDFEISDESESAFNDYVKKHNFPISRATTMKAGDATFHRGFTIHNAPGNNSDKTRQVMTIIYLADGAHVSEPKNQWQKNDRAKWLLDKPVGELIDSGTEPEGFIAYIRLMMNDCPWSTVYRSGVYFLLQYIKIIPHHLSNKRRPMLTGALVINQLKN